jgi:xylulokinase
MTTTDRNLFIGVDSGTQSTKVLIVDGESGVVVASASAAHDFVPDLPPGHVEQRPEHWFDALDAAMRAALRTASAAGADAAAVRAIGVSGQQHGFVPLDARGEVIRPAKLWCDTSTAPQCRRIIDALGGLDRMIALTGNGLPPGFTASKIAWLKEHEPAAFARLAAVLLPHDYLNYRLTGQLKTECGDASGTGLFDVRTRTWQAEVAGVIDAHLLEKLPPLISADAPHGELRRELASRWGLPGGVAVAAGGGDNMMSAIGTGNVREGVVTVSLGTSGTIFAYSARPVIDPRGEVAAFCDSTGGWLPLVCTMNVTTATESTRALFGLDLNAMEEAAGGVPPGSDGLLLLPYFEGERTPDLPDAAGVWFGANRRTHTAAHFCRAAMEGATLGLRYGMERLRDKRGLAPSRESPSPARAASREVPVPFCHEIRLTGGGSRSRLWRQIVADVFGVPVVCLDQPESAALGAAVQARWCWQRRQGRGVSIADLANAWVKPVEATRAKPTSAATAVYDRLFSLQTELSSSLRKCFTKHRDLVSQETNKRGAP